MSFDMSSGTPPLLPHPHGSKESLPAHPLLSPSPSTSLNAVPTVTPSGVSSSPPGTKYVPYTPRQRLAASSSSPATSTNATALPTSSVAQGGATRELQRQNMKAEIQGLGLSGESAGWMMLDKLSSLSAADEEWEEIWGMITAGKATLLVPKEPIVHNEVTPELVRDHVAFCNSASSSTSPLVTLSGLRGLVEGDTLTFRSTLPTSSTQFTNLISATSRGPTLQSLSPLPHPITPFPSPPYPSVTIMSHPGPIPLPPRPSPVPPPLPVRPKAPPPHTGRLSLPFSSLFGSRGTTTPTSTVAPQPVPSQEHIALPAGDGPTIEAWPIDKVIRRREIGRDISRAVKGEVKLSLTGLPPWLVDRVISFLSPCLPENKPSKLSKLRPSSGYPPPSPSTAPEQTPTPETFQSFYASLASDLQLHFEHSGSPLLGRKGSKELDREKEKDSEAEEKEAERVDTEKRVRDALDRVESVVCSLLYDRIFCPLDSDDSRHDEALASRIAALNMLDLGLEHLGVDVIGGGSNEGVQEVVHSCGDELQRLQEFQAPKDKAAILVSAHKIVVDGLARLPPLRLRPEAEVEERTARPAMISSDEPTARPLAALPSTDYPEVRSPVHAKEPSNGLLLSNLDASNTSVEGSAENEHDDSQDVAVGSPPPVPALKLPQTTGVKSVTSPPKSPISSHLHSRSHSPSPLRSPSSPQPTSSADLLLPLIIFSVVKSNPAQLVSHLLYVQRYRDSTIGGEENYCLINLSAVVEFLEHVDLGALGLGGEHRVMSIDDLTPIPLARSPSARSEEHNVGTRLRGTVNQVGELAASTNKVISGVVDSSFTALRGLLTQAPIQDPTSPDSPAGDLSKIAPWNNARPGFGLLRRASGFSIASMAAGLPGGVSGGRTRSMRGDDDEEEGARPLVEVSSRPGSIREDVETEGDETEETGEEGEEGETDEEMEREEMGYRSDVRSVKSFSSMMSRQSRERDERRERMSISDRLAGMAAGRFAKSPPTPEAVLRRASPPPSRRTSLLAPSQAPARPPSDSPSPSPRASSPAPASLLTRIAPPSARFMQCTPDDLRVSEVGELLREYRRVVAALKAAGGFEE